MGIGIIGLGVVGKALYDVMRIFHKDVKGYDVVEKRSQNSFNTVIRSDILFLTLPTILKDQATLDVTPIDDTLAELARRKYKGLVVVKSTLPFGYLRKAMADYTSLNIVHVPEILHVTAPILELVTPQYLVVSETTDSNLRMIQNVFYWVPTDKFRVISIDAAALYKLVQNTFACVKISFTNEVERFCKRHGIDPESVLGTLRLDKRCADEYTYPNRGPYGGTCLPKDIQELCGAYPDNILFKAAQQVNERVQREGED